MNDPLEWELPSGWFDIVQKRAPKAARRLESHQRSEADPIMSRNAEGILVPVRTVRDLYRLSNVGRTTIDAVLRAVWPPAEPPSVAEAVRLRLATIAVATIIDADEERAFLRLVLDALEREEGPRPMTPADDDALFQGGG